MFLGYYPSLCRARVFLLIMGGRGCYCSSFFFFSSLSSLGFFIFRFLFPFFVFLYPLFVSSPSFLSSFSCSPFSFLPASFLFQSSSFCTILLVSLLFTFVSSSSLCSLPYFSLFHFLLSSSLSLSCVFLSSFLFYCVPFLVICFI